MAPARPFPRPSLALFAMLMLVVATACTKKALPEIEVYGDLPRELAFTTQEGKAFSRADVEGKVSVVNFIFTRCPTVCPTFTMKMQKLGKELPKSIQLLSFSVDPEYDTPERLQSYAADFDADPARWRFLTGDAKQLRETVEGAMKIRMDEVSRDERGVPDIVHGVHFVLLDREGRIRGYYDSDEAERIDDLRRDAKRLAKQ